MSDEIEVSDTINQRDVDDIIPYSNNPKEHPDKQVKKIASSIKNYGWDQPIVVDGDGEIIKGHGRLQAAEMLDLSTVPVVERTDLSDSEKQAARVADNKTAESPWDDELLSLELEQLDDQFEAEELGFDDDELTELLKSLDEGNDEGENKYTDKIESPVYEPTGPKPDIEDLYDDEQYQQLIQQVEQADIDENLRQFLRYAAQRHIVFDYENIAEYFAHESQTVQELMEALTLVIVDYDKAVEQGFVEFADTVMEDV